MICSDCGHPIEQGQPTTRDESYSVVHVDCPTSTNIILGEPR